MISYGYAYSVRATLSEEWYDTRKYEEFTLPKGYYTSLKIEIGSAEGQNWWCSLFPPLCFVDVSSGIIDETSEKKLKENLSKEEFSPPL